MIHVAHPPGYEAERHYICDVLFGEFLGLDCRCTPGEADQWRIMGPGLQEGRALTMPDVLFQTARPDWLTERSLPRRPLPLLAVDGYAVPVIYGDSRLQVSPDAIHLGADIPGSAFFLLTRYEEAVCPQRDRHGRFPASGSIAWKEGFLTRPVVNEYLELMWWALRRLWPGLQRRERHSRVLLSHDVDAITCARGRPLKQVLRSCLGDLVRRRSPALAANRVASWRCRAPEQDLCFTFDAIMDLAEAQGWCSAFYFIAGRSEPAYDAEYDVAEPHVLRLMRRIGERGHEVGLHPSYHTYLDPQRLAREFAALRAAAESARVFQPAWGGRQHYLRWAATDTWAAWDEAGLTYDSTLSFADTAGFRCGVCYEYPVFDLRSGRRLALRERPLVVMEATLLEYMGQGPNLARETIRTLAAISRRYRGDFTLLWHNDRLSSPAELALFRAVLRDLGTG